MSGAEALDTRPGTGAGTGAGASGALHGSASPSSSSSSPSSSSLNPLVAQREESRSAVSGSGVVEDIWGIAHGLSEGSWLETGLSSVSLVADAVGVGVDPLGTLIAWGAGWLIDHFGPLRSWMDEFLGDADSVRADAATWSNVAQAMGECADSLEQDERGLMGEQVGATARGYRAANHDTISALRTASGAADAMGGATSVLAEVVGVVHDLLRDAISAIVGTLASAIIEAIATFGLAIPLIIAQVQVKVGAKATEMAAHITGVLKSARTLAHNLTHLSGLLDMLRGMLTRAKGTAANAAHMLTGAKPAAAAAGGATPHGPVTGTTAPASAHTSTGTGHTAHHTPPPAPNTPPPAPDTPPTTPKPRRKRRLVPTEPEKISTLKHGTYIDEDSKLVVGERDKRPYIRSRARPGYRRESPLFDPENPIETAQYEGTVEGVWRRAQDASPDGIVRDPATGDVIEWEIGQPRRDIWDMGHKPDFQYRDEFKLYLEGDLSLEDFRSRQQDPSHYRPELPKSNRGGKGEEIP